MKRSTALAGVVGLAAGLALTACGGSSPGSSPAASLIAQIPGCGQVQTWGGDSLDNTTSNGECYLNDGGTQVKILTWPAGDTADQASYANSGSLAGPGPCTITGTNPVPWAADLENISNDAPAYASSVQQTITGSIGGTSPGGAACTGSSPVIPSTPAS